MTAKLMIRDKIEVVDSELGSVRGVVVGHNHEGKPLVKFGGNPPVVIHDWMKFKVVSVRDEMEEMGFTFKQA